MALSNRKALIAGWLAASAVSAGIYWGSRGLKHFDPATLWYAIGSVLAAFAVAFRFTVWAQRPPSRMYFKRGFQILLRRAPASLSRITHPPLREAPRSEHGSRGAPINGETLPRFNPPAPPPPALALAQALTTDFAAQSFIRRRSVYRWIMHLCLSGGCTLAFAITFPLVFGWVHFEAFADKAETYHVMVFGFAVDSLRVNSAKAFIVFNLLNFSAVVVMIGLVMAAARRLTDAGERATQKFFEDILPLLLIFAVTATGLMLTVSYKFMAGQGHHVIAVAHLVSVVALLFYIPFGKLFHMFQRLCSLCVSLYRKEGKAGPRALCLRCGEDYASQMHVDDLKLVLDQLGFNYRFATAGGEVHYQDVCPACRRRLLALNQGRTVRR